MIIRLSDEWAKMGGVFDGADPRCRALADPKITYDVREAIDEVVLSAGRLRDESVVENFILDPNLENDLWHVEAILYRPYRGFLRELLLAVELVRQRMGFGICFTLEMRHLYISVFPEEEVDVYCSASEGGIARALEVLSEGLCEL